MTQKVDIRDNSAVSVMVLMAVTKHVKDPEFAAAFAGKGSVVEVAMTVNGQTVDAPAVLAEAWRREVELIDKRARKMAIEMVTEAGLDGLVEILRDAENKVRQKLNIWDEETFR
jgi:hypothetical protein